MKKFLSLLLVVAMLLPLLCVSAVAEEPVEIKILAQIWAPYKEEQMDIFREIEKACNVKFTIEWAPRDGFNERVYSTLASGQLPDLIARQGLSESSLINEGAIVPLDDYLQYAPNYVAAIGEDKASLTNASDGYLYPISSIIDIQPAYGMFVRKDWLERVGLDVPNTWEEWLTVWRAFRDQDANGNGDPNDEIPFTAAGEHIPGAWGTSPLLFVGIISNQYFYLDGNTYQLVYDHPRYREYLEVMQLLYSEGLMDKEVVTHTYQDTGALQSAGVAGSALEFTDRASSAVKTLQETDTNATFVATLPMVGTHGEQYMPARAKFDGRGFYVTIQAEKDGKMEAIMRVVDYLFSEEGTKLINFGIEGQHYTMVNGAPVLNKEILDGGWQVAREAGLANQTFILHWIEAMFSQMTFKGKTMEEMNAVETLSAQAFNMYGDYFYNIPPVLQTAAYAEYATDLLPKCEELRAKCVTGEITVDEFFAQYEALKPLGLDEMNKQAQEAWNMVKGL
ncbi:MAG TPA: extracellular solute-binding protein [Clostridia bacterium]|jgi:ABC-type glycerol-3-phosphate transport system substrate-binding protein|nr:extracellular solute-binding protein [Clostridia bacterium]